MQPRRNPYLGTLLVIAMAQHAHATDITWDSLGANDNWSTFDNWSDNATPVGDDITFNNDGRASGATVTSIVDTDFAIDSLRFTHDNTSNHTLSISDTLTLSITGSFTPTNGQATAMMLSKPDGVNTATTNITGLGTFTVNNASNHFLVGFQNATSGSRATLDMSALDHFNATVNVLGVGRKGTINTDTTRQESGYLVLAKNSNVTATAITVGDSTGINGTAAAGINQGSGSTLFLSAGGDRVNNLNADTMIFGRGKASGTIQFATGAVSTDTVKLRGKAGGSAAVGNFILGDRNMSSTSGTPTGTVNFGAGKVDGLITNLYAGRWGTSAGSSAVSPTGTFTTGTNADSVVTVTTANLALGESTGIPTGSVAQIVTGNLNVSGGVFSVTTLNLATGSTNALVTRVAKVTVDGGTFRFGTIGAPTTGGSTNINFNSGTVSSINNTARTFGLAYNLGKTGGGTTVTFGQASGGTGPLTLSESGTLLGDTALETVQDTTLGGAVGGAFSLTKTGPGALTLSGANTYTGNTTVSTGSLELTSAGSLTFRPLANGITNKVTGPGTVAFKGTFNLDLTNAAVADDNSWVLADVPGQTFDETSFTVAGGFIESPEGTWKLAAGANNWTFTQSDATLRLDVTASGYANWLTLFPGILDPAAGADPENDGIENVLEYVLNGNPTTSDPAILPDLDTSGANFVFTFTRRQESPSDTTQIFQYGTNLSAWTDVAITGTPGSEVTLGIPSGGLQDVTVTIPKSAGDPGGKLFGRLQAVKLP